MWRTGLRGSIYEVQRECLSWWVMDSKLITPPPPVSHNEQKLWRGAHYKSYGPGAQCTTHTHTHTHTTECTLQVLLCMYKSYALTKILVHLYRFIRNAECTNHPPQHYTCIKLCISYFASYIFSGNRNNVQIFFSGKVSFNDLSATFMCCTGYAEGRSGWMVDLESAGLWLNHHFKRIRVRASKWNFNNNII